MRMGRMHPRPHPPSSLPSTISSAASTSFRHYLAPEQQQLQIGQPSREMYNIPQLTAPTHVRAQISLNELKPRLSPICHRRLIRRRLTRPTSAPTRSTIP